MSDLREMFFEECDDLLEGLSTGLTALEGDTGDDETINSMFRSVHSIKGGAGAFGMDRLIEFAHAFENVLDLLRSDKLQVDGPITALMFLATDHLSDLVNAARDEIDLPASEGLSVLSDLKLVTQDPGAAPTAVADAQEEDVTGFVPLTLDLGDAFTELPDTSGAIIECAFDISFAAEPALYANGHDPALLFRTLSKMGELSISADTSAVKPLEADTGELAALSWSLHLVPDEGVNEEAVREVFEFVEGLCQLTITTCSPDDAPELSIPEDTEAVDHLPAGTEAPTKAAAAVGAKKKSDEARNATIRVDLKRVDRLINLVGELVISEAMLRQSIDELPRSANSAVSEAFARCSSCFRGGRLWRQDLRAQDPGQLRGGRAHDPLQLGLRGPSRLERPVSSCRSRDAARLARREDQRRPSRVDIALIRNDRILLRQRICRPRSLLLRTGSPMKTPASACGSRAVFQHPPIAPEHIGPAKGHAMIRDISSSLAPS